MTARLIADKLIGIESAVADLDWRHTGVDLWPLYRNEVRARLSISLLDATTPRVKLDLSAIVRGLPPRRLVQTGGPRVVLLNDGYSIQNVGGRFIDRFCSPIAAGLDRLGIESVLLDQTQSPVELGIPTERIAGRVLRAKLKAVAIARVTRDAWTAERCRRLAQAATAAGVGAEAIPSLGEMVARRVALFDLAAMFETTLSRLQATCVLQVNYYSLAGMAMNLAAHRAGLEVVEVQHGVIDRQHMAYRGPHRAGADALMPTAYWVWTEEEAEVILADPPPNARVLVGGHPLVEAWRGGRVVGVAESRTRARQLRAGAPDRRHALVTLQPGLTSRAALEPLLQAMREASGIVWLVRGHPASLSDLPTVAEMMQGTGAGYEIVETTALPLYAVLEQTDVHLTHSSTTAVEAAAFGVPSILWSVYGKELFAGLADRGVARTGIDGVEIVQMLRSPWACPKGVDPSHVDRLDHALLTLTR